MLNVFSDLMLAVAPAADLFSSFASGLDAGIHCTWVRGTIGSVGYPICWWA